jgi:hypothetical protein
MAKPIKGTNQADLILVGTDGDDTIQGKGGDDGITGGKGNDQIDGGNGIDTAFYSGSYNDYLIAFKGTGNNKVTVEDTVADRDGTDALKQVEFLRFADATVNVNTGEVDQWHYHVNATLDDSAQDPAHLGTMIAGSGIPATAFGIAHNPSADTGIELGLAVHHRSTSPAAVQSSDNYNDGELHFQVAAGADPASASANRAEWNFDWSVATGVDGQPTNLDDFKFTLLVDVDPTGATNYLEFTMASGGAGAAQVHWTDQYGHVIVDDDGIANLVAQNSQNYGFGYLRDSDPVAPGAQNYNFGAAEFDIILEARDLVDNHLLALNHIVVDVV